ncbi:MAG: DUF4192 domain-containing protein [Austwickia sp.]|nr:MAG: DUF4192 domain-containing protein [Austwickia sp.]
MPATRISQPEHLVVLIPYALGYHPRSSLVLMGVRGNALGVTEAVGWPPPWGRFGPEEAATMAAVLVRDGCTAVLLIAYDGRPLRRLPAVDQITEAVEAAGVIVLDRLTVTEDRRWGGLDCEDPRCCPPGGRALPPPSDVPAVAEWVLRGIDPYPDRDAMAATIEPSSTTEMFDFTGLRRVRPSAALARRAWGTVLGFGSEGGSPADIPAAVAWQALATAAVPALRDEVLELICPGLLGGPDPATDGAGAVAVGPGVQSGGLPRTPYDVLGAGAAAQQRLRRLTEFARRLPEQHRAEPLAMTAVCAWWYGQGTLARICLDRVHVLAPAHRLSALVEAMLDHGLGPRRDCA